MTPLEIVVAIVMLVGLAGTVIPILPGLPLIVAGGVAWAILGDVGVIGWVVALAMTAVGVAGIVIAGILPARRGLAAGTPPWVLAIAGIGVVVGAIVIPVVGAFIGGPAALFVAELIRLRDAGDAWRATREALKGLGIAMIVQLVAGVAMIAVWLTGVAFT